MPKPGKETKSEHWTKLIRSMMEEPAWRALSPTAQALYPWLKLEWRGPNNNNNGRICLSVRQAAQRLGVSDNTAAKAFHDLQAKGFIVQTETPCLGVNGAARGAMYELTELACNKQDSPAGRKLYKTWTEGSDFPVKIARANNPHGRNGKTKPHRKRKTSHLQIYDVDEFHIFKTKTGNLKTDDVQGKTPGLGVIIFETSLIAIPSGTKEYEPEPP